MNFAAKVKHLAKRRKIDIDTVAHHANVSSRELQRIVREDLDPSATTALLVSRALDVPVDWLIDFGQGLRELRTIDAEQAAQDKALTAGSDDASRQNAAREFAVPRQVSVARKRRAARKKAR